MCVQAHLAPEGMRLLEHVCTYRYINIGEPLFYEGEIGNSFAIILEGVLQPSHHGAVSAPLANSSASKHWHALGTVTKLMAGSRIKLPPNELTTPPGGGGPAKNKKPPPIAPTDSFATRVNNYSSEMDQETASTAVARANQLGPGHTVGMAALIVGDKGAACDWHRHDDAIAAERTLVAIITKGQDLQQMLEVRLLLSSALPPPLPRGTFSRHPRLFPEGGTTVHA